MEAMWEKGLYCSGGSGSAPPPTLIPGVELAGPYFPLRPTQKRGILPSLVDKM